MRQSTFLISACTAFALVAGSIEAEAQRRFGGGGFHMRGGSMHARVPTNVHGPGSGKIHTASPPRPAGGGARPAGGPPPGPHPGPNPGPHPGPNPGPGPGPHPGPGPGPAPHPGPGPGPGPHPGPPPPPPPRPLPPPPPPPPPGWGWGWGWDDDPFWDVAAGAVIAGTTAAVVSAATQPDVVVVDTSNAPGTVVYALPPNCPKVIRSNVTYFSCNNIWYKPQYLSSGVSYVIVTAP